MSFIREKEKHVLFKDIEVLSSYIDEVRSNIWECNPIPHQLGFIAMYNNILKRAKELYSDDEVIFLLKSLPFQETDEHFTLMRNIHLLRNHIEAGLLETTIENLQTELNIAHKKLDRLRAIA